MSSDDEKLFPTFKRRERPRKFFTQWKVFYALWTEPARSEESTSTSGISEGLYGEKAFSKVRRFIVVRPGDNHCTAIPISTYGSRGLAAPGKNKSEHAMVYSGKSIPTFRKTEQPGPNEKEPFKTAIRVDADDPVQKLDPLSRLNLGALYTIDHCIKVRAFGKVNPKSVPELKRQLCTIWKFSLGVSLADPTQPSPSSPPIQQLPLTVSPQGPETWNQVYRLLKENGQMSDAQIRDAISYGLHLFASQNETEPGAS